MIPDWLVPLLSAVGIPVSMILGGWLVDRRAKRSAETTAKFTKETVAVTAKEAATHEFEAITTGFTEYTEALERQNARLGTQNARLEELVTEMDQRFRELDRRHRAALDHIDLLETLVPADRIPRRPQRMGEA